MTRKMEPQDPLPVSHSPANADIPDAEKSKADLLMDIQRLREQSRQVQQTAAYYRGLFDGLADMVMIRDADGRIADANNAAVENLRYSLEDLRTLRLRDVVSPDSTDRIADNVGRVLAGEHLLFEAVFLASNGRRIRCEVAEHAMECGGAQAILTVARDISSRTWTPQEIAESEQKYRTLFEDSLEAMSLIQDGKIVDVNMAWLKLHGFSSKSEVVGKDVMSLVHEDDRSILARRRQSGTADPKRLYEVRDVKKDGSVVDVELYSSTLTMDGKPAIITTVRDISERKRHEREREQLVRLLSESNLSLEKMNMELERSNRELEDFGHVVSHDLQEPLRMVGSYLELLAERCGDKLDPEAQEFIQYAVTGAKGMQQLITDLLDYARLDMTEKSSERVDFEDVIEHALSNLRASINESGAVVTHDALPTMTGDASQFGQLLQNLVGNAIKFRSAATPKIHISARQKKDVWLFSVQDNGIGIEPDYAQRIFTIFQRLHSKSKYTGSGIGLSICKKIVVRHGGNIWVESALGSGSTFYFTLPCEKEEEPAKPAPSRRGTIQILLAEDNEGDARLMRETLKDLKVDANLHWVEDGVDALAFLHREDQHTDAPRPDLILLDLNMPRKNGHEVLAEIKATQELWDIPVAVITTSRDKRDIMKTGTLHATWYVTKPVDLVQVLNLVDAVRGG
ncbi:MAG: PAS domain S-box protein [Planctomycetes bacterium]|nr:PAS domain S-box protein [Planctomycetota bacterium]